MSIPSLNNTSTSLKYILGTIVIVCGIAAYVILAITVPDTTARGAIIILVTPLASMLFVSGAVDGRMQNIEAKTDTVVDQTNGKLRAEAHQIATNAAFTAVAMHRAEAAKGTKPRGARPRNIVRGTD